MSDKIDANDLASECGSEGLRRELQAMTAAAAAAVTALPVEKPAPVAVEEDDEKKGKRPDYYALALDYLHANGMGTPGDDCQLVYWKEDFYTFTGTHFERRSNAEFNAFVTRFLQGHAIAKARVSNNLINNVIQNLKGICVLSDNYMPPVWKDQQPVHKPNIVAVENGLIDVDELVKDVAGYAPMQSTPRMFITSALPFKYDAGAACERWLKALARILPQDLQDLLQELGGYSFTLDTSFQVFMILHGEGNNGKSVFLAGLKAALGKSNYSELPLEVLQAEKTALLEPLRGKRANIIEETGAVTKVSEGFFKILTGGGSMDADRKFKESYELVGTAKWWLATNERPHFGDRSKGTYRRMIVVPFAAEITKEERIPGMDKPVYWHGIGELPGMFLWFMQGLKRLRERREILLPQACEIEREEYKKEMQPERRFLVDYYEAREGSNVHSQTLYETYLEYMKEEGCQGKLNKNNFGKAIPRIFSGAKSRAVGGARYWFGVCRKSSEEIAPSEARDQEGRSPSSPLTTDA